MTYIMLYSIIGNQVEAMLLTLFGASWRVNSVIWCRFACWRS